MPLPLHARLVLALLLLGVSPLAAAERIDFNRDVRPILAKNCFACHGPDAEHRESGLHLGDPQSATSELDSGARAIVPGKPDASELVARIAADDESLKMPPKDSGHELTPAEIDTLKNWIANGAVYARHWSFEKPVLPDLPAPRDRAWIANEIDAFVRVKLEAAGLSPAPPADRYALIRRLSLDLRGLPPSPAEVREFVADTHPDAYARLVDRFLDDPAYGERWARMWLDLARYADSRGYGSDPLRENIWRYRDWVIEAFNRNLPYDQFSTEQLAGDLLAEPTLDQLVATAFHRNTMTNTEGGTDDEEFRVAAVKDRVDTTLQVWMGLTIGCAQCHNHKYDPLSQREYYQVFAIFNQTEDRDQPNEAPVIDAPTPTYLQTMAEIDRKIAAARERMAADTPELVAARDAWEAKQIADLSSEAKPVSARFVRVEQPGNAQLLSLAEVEVFWKDENLARAGKARQSSTDYDGPAELAVDGNTNGHYFDAKSTTHTKTENNPWWEVDLGSDKPIDKVNLWNRTDGNLHTRLKNFKLLLQIEKTAADGKTSRETVWSTTVVEPPNPNREFAIDSRVSVPENIRAILLTDRAARTDAQRGELNEHYRSIAPELNALRQEIAALEKSRPEMPTVPVMKELPPDKRRATHLHVRGNFLAPGDPVEAGVPEIYSPQTEGDFADRLALARWLFDADNPLTARVAVNRFWARIFGQGLVVTEEDFGTQGELPSHSELLDWLAIEFQRDWDMKRLLKLIVMSSTYRQSAEITPEKLDADPRNRLLSRGPRGRLEAEMVRDQALALSGLLSRKSFGPSVYPPQPPGLWRAAFNGQRTWPESQGEDKYRRGLYTFWRRTIPYPSMATFDAPSREICNIRRIHTNTPLQAFVTMNDPVYVETSQALARRILAEGGDDTASRVRYAIELCLIQEPQSGQIEALAGLLETERNHYREHPEEARKLAGSMFESMPAGTDPAEAAAWTVVANVLLNLDAVLMK